MRKALFIGAAIATLSLTGCEIYFGQGGGNCEAWGDCPVEPVAPGGDCAADDQCMAGCVCQDGECVETGFCDSNFDCAGGMVCDVERATCTFGEVSCADDLDCSQGYYCDQATGQCQESWGCDGVADCGPGFECNAQGTCVPVGCAVDTDCLEGCYCGDSGTCEETGFCNDDADCPQENMLCDEARQTCTPNALPDINCGGEINCAVAAPECGPGETAVISDGCYTGECHPIVDCPDDPIIVCAGIQDENVCRARPDCEQFWPAECFCPPEDPGCDCVGNPDCTCTISDTPECISIGSEG